MMTILYIVLGGAVVCGIGAYIFSDKGDAKERAGEAAVGAAAGAAMITGCLLQLVIPAIGLLIGLWILSKLFGG